MNLAGNDNQSSEDNGIKLLNVISENSDNGQDINWETVANVYNNPQSDEGNEKNPSNLERHFKALKRETTKKLAKNKKEYGITGGGKAQLEDLTDCDKVIIDMLETQIHGLPSILDCDGKTA
jgi:hypothetical protein